MSGFLPGSSFVQLPRIEEPIAMRLAKRVSHLATALFDPKKLSALWQDSAGTTPVAASGDPVGRIDDLTGHGYNAVQAAAGARPKWVIADNGDRVLQNDEFDDVLAATLPDLGTDATIAYVTQSEVYLEEGLTIGAGAYNLPQHDLLGFAVFDRALTTVEKIMVIRWLASKAQGVTYGGDIDAITLACLNAVDVFVYDTSKDSDGGAWRTGALAQASSWYNETLNTATRGSRREFPAVAVIVAEAAKVTIYDADDPALPMWRVWDFTGYTLAALVTLNGKIAVSTSTGLAVLDLPNDLIAVGLDYTTATSPAIVNSTVNDVAMTVLPDAPTDPATGLPVPTIAVATAGGVSVITDAGTVYDSSKTTACTDIAFDDNDLMRATYSDGSSVTTDPASISADGFTGTTLNASSTPALFGTATSSAHNALGSTSGLALLGASNAMAARITKDYNTGWMPGDIRGAWLASRDTAALVASGELVTNGTFDTDLSGWTNESQGLGSVSVVGGQATITSSGGSDIGKFSQTLNTIPGQFYKLSCDAPSGGTGGYLALEINGSYYKSFFAGTSGNTTFKATGATTKIGFRIEGNNGSRSVDNVSVHLAAPDRSVKNNGLTVNGTITRAPVATGAELVGYSGFSAANYLEGTDASYADTLYALGWEQTGGVWEFKHGVVSAAPIDGLTITGTTLKIEGTKPKALIRLTATVPTADQLVKIENDESALFQENAACTLYGASDAVTALAHDPDTGLLHVGTSSGRSVFHGLERIQNNTTSVSKAISAVGGLVAAK